MNLLHLSLYTVLCCSLLLPYRPYANINSRSKEIISRHEPIRHQPNRLFAGSVDSYAGKLNEFVLDGTESCVEIKRGSSSIRPALTAVTNAANFNDRIAPGGLAVVWGTGFSDIGEEYVATTAPVSRRLGRVQVLWRAADWDSIISGSNSRCGWRAAPLLYVGPNQINFQVPMFYYRPIGEEDGSGYGRFANFEGRDYEFIVLQVLRDGVTKVSSN